MNEPQFKTNRPVKESGTLHFRLGEGIGELIRDVFWFERRFEWGKDTLRCFQGITYDQMASVLIGEAQLKPIDNGTRMALVVKEDKKFKKKLSEHVYWVKGYIEKLYKDLYSLETSKEKMFSSMFTPRDNDIRLITMDIRALREKIDSFEEVLKYYGEFLRVRIVPETTIDIGGYEISAPLLEEYAKDIVFRLRQTLKVPGLALLQNPIELMEMEQRRQELHEKIMKAAGFTKAKRNGEKFREFSKALEKFLEKMGAGLYEHNI